MNNINLIPLYLSIYLAIITSIILIIISIPIAWILSKIKIKILKKIIETLVALPLVLPPTILGFYLIYFLNPSSNIGKIWNALFGFDLVFSMTGLLIGSIIYSLPFAIQPINIAFENISLDIINLSKILQLSKYKTFIKIILPLSKNSILTSFILSFAHTIGEFGVALMIGGNIQGKTQVISIAIYESFELLNYKNTHILSAIVIIISFLILLTVFYINKK